VGDRFLAVDVNSLCVTSPCRAWSWDFTTYGKKNVAVLTDSSPRPCRTDALVGVGVPAHRDCECCHLLPPPVATGFSSAHCQPFHTRFAIDKARDDEDALNADSKNLSDHVIILRNSEFTLTSFKKKKKQM
jgi:hypothetical protein